MVLGVLFALIYLLLSGINFQEKRTEAIVEKINHGIN